MHKIRITLASKDVKSVEKGVFVFHHPLYSGLSSVLRTDVSQPAHVFCSLDVDEQICSNPALRRGICLAEKKISLSQERKPVVAVYIFCASGVGMAAVHHSNMNRLQQCLPTLCVTPRRSSCRSRAPCACPPRLCASPPARPLAVRVPRPGTASRCASTSVSSTCTAPRRLSSRLYVSCHTCGLCCDLCAGELE